MKKGILAGLMLAVPFLAYAWNCQTNFLHRLYFVRQEDGSIYCSHGYLFCYIKPCEGGRFVGHCAFSYGNIVEPLNLSQPDAYAFYGTCLYRASICSCDCDLNQYKPPFLIYDCDTSDDGSGGGVVVLVALPVVSMLTK